MSDKESGLHSLGSEKPLKYSKQERGMCDQIFISKKGTVAEVQNMDGGGTWRIFK